jgi:peptidoglycan/xylan/chitin deacetylase (PgdA/CDA1 family)
MKFSLFALLAIGVIACSSPQKKPAQLAESHPDRVARAISSDIDEEAMGRTYDRLLASEDPAAEMTGYFNRLVAIYFRTDNLLKDYDKHLDDLYQNKNDAKISDLQTHESYARLISAWIMRERMTSKLTYIYRRNVEGMFNRGDNSPAAEARRQQVLAVNNAFKRALKKHGQGENKIALQSLYAELIQELQEYRAEKKLLRHRSSEREESALGKNLFATAKEQEVFIQSKRVDINARVSAATQDVQVNEEIAELQPDVQTYLEDQFSGREPNADGDVVASSSSKGNLTGNTFRTGRWALTYDDGPSGKHTTTILNNLEARDMKASFFWLSSLTPSYPTLINRAKGLGMALGNHSHSHANLPKLGPQGLKREIVDSTATHARMYGAKPTFFRCPYGACGGNGSTIRQMIANEGMVHIFWNIDSLDWQDKNAASITTRVTKAMAIAKKGIILYHDIHPQSVESTRMLMDAWAPEIKAGRLRLLTIPQAISELNSAAGMQ